MHSAIYLIGVATWRRWMLKFGCVVTSFFLAHFTYFFKEIRLTVLSSCVAAFLPMAAVRTNMGSLNFVW
jgi:hypothetical protein